MRLSVRLPSSRVSAGPFKRMPLRAAFAVLAFLMLTAAPDNSALPTFSLLTPHTACSDTTQAVFATGQQYVNADNGVPFDRWSMLVRWQGTRIPGHTEWIEYPAAGDFSDLIGLDVPSPRAAWQRGYHPEDPVSATPVVQMHCLDAGMLINSRYAPHQDVLGGGWNDMYGYAWSPEKRPKAFLWGSGIPAELVLQGNLAMPLVQGYIEQPDGSWSAVADLNAQPMEVSIQYNLFAYIRDGSHPDLPPIALLAGVYGNGGAIEGCRHHLGYDYPEGVWFVGTTIHDPEQCTTPYSTVRGPTAYSTNKPFSESSFYRIHFSRSNLRQIVRDINAHGCDGVCPDRGYSVDPDDYLLDYYGVILETTVCDLPDMGCSTSLPNRQVVAAARARAVLAFSYHD